MDSFQGLTSKVPHHGNDLWLHVQIFYDHVNQATRHTIDHSAGGKLHDKSIEESWELIEDLVLYDNKSCNDPRDFAEPVKAISLPQDVPSTSDRRLVELENQVQHLMEAHLAPKPSVQVKKITSSCEICGGPHDTKYCMENPEQAFVDYASSRTNEVGESILSSLWTRLKKQQDEVINKINTLWKVVLENFENAPTRDIAKNFMVHANVASHDHRDSGALPNKGIIKTPSKLFSPKFQAKSSLREENRNSSSQNASILLTQSPYDDRNLVENEPEVLEEEGGSSDIENDDKASNIEGEACKHETELGEEGEWMEY
ncbi:hypothetical protein Tco_0804896 [Tanacetum coccineum]